MTRRTRGQAPSKLTGQLPVSAERSPWWELEVSRMGSFGILVGHTYTAEELAELFPSYPDGRRPRPRTVVRRLRELEAIQLVERGPNGSLSKGATYKVLPERPSPPAGEVEPLPDNAEFLEDAVERMTSRRRGKV